VHVTWAYRGQHSNNYGSTTVFFELFNVFLSNVMLSYFQKSYLSG